MAAKVHFGAGTAYLFFQFSRSLLNAQLVMAEVLYYGKKQYILEKWHRAPLMNQPELFSFTRNNNIIVASDATLGDDLIYDLFQLPLSLIVMNNALS